MSMRLPELPYNIQKAKSEIVSMRGINYSDILQDGDVLDSKNISARRFPYITARRARQQDDTYSGCDALFSVDRPIGAPTVLSKLVAVCGTDLYFNGAVVGQVEEMAAGQRQFAVVNSKLVIWPDKVYIDLTAETPTIVHLLSVFVNPRTFAFAGKSTLNFTWAGVDPFDIRDYFKVGDAIKISGIPSDPNNNKTFFAKEVNQHQIIAEGEPFTVSEQSYAALTLTREIPDMDYICESENRLWGCSSETQTIYASALGDPTNFNNFRGLSTDSYALAVGSDGDFTGCCSLSNSVLFWKQNKLHKILGSYPAEYTLYSFDIEGLLEGCHNSLQIINETLFFYGLHGVYAYTGGTPTLISENFGEKKFTNAVAGNDGDSYYLSVKEGDKYHLLVYETQTGLWVHEDDVGCIQFTRLGKDVYFADVNGDVYLEDAGEEDPDIEWFLRFTPFYETIQGKKVYSKMIFRVELPIKSFIIAEIRKDDGAWREAGRIIGTKNNIVSMRVPISRCDKFELRLSGKGPFAIHSILREFSIGSEV